MKQSPRRILWTATTAIAFLMISPGVWAQSQTQDQSRGQNSSQDRGQKRNEGQNTPLPVAPDIATENLSFVAGPADQIQKILREDPGLMVELKRWVARDAAMHDQIVSEPDLSDQAIFDRLDSDVKFRSIATLLLQRYGYLLPTVNPKSELAKERELLVQERSKWLAQDSEMARQKALQATQQRQTCDPQSDRNCTFTTTTQQSAFPSATEPNAPQGGGGVEENPQDLQGFPLEPRAPSRTGGQMENAPSQLTQTTADIESTGPPLQVVSQASRGSLSPYAANAGYPPAAGGGGSQELAALVQGNPGVQGGRNTPYNPDTLATGEMPPQPTYFPGIYGRPWPPFGPRSGATIYPQPPMISKPDPYAGIPSLYDMYKQVSSRQEPPKRFGIDVFDRQNQNSQLIPMDLPVSPSYVVGPGDGLAIDLWGGVSQRMYRTVDREGRVSLPEVGPVLVSGKSLGDVQQILQKVLRTEFRDVSADVSLSRLRTVRIYVVGDVAHPGAYDVSSLSTPLNALFAAGGPTSAGSLRVLEHFRGKDLLQSVDVYDLLLRGVRSDIERLENGDTVRVPPLGPEVTVEGMVRRPALYELHGEKSLADALALAGGILPTAALGHIEVQRLEAHEKRTMLSLNVSQGQDSAGVTQKLSSFTVQDGDIVNIFPIAPYNQDAVYLEGHVLRPGRYAYRQGMKLTDVVSSYSDLLPEPAGQYAEIIRLEPPDFRPVVVSFDLSVAMTNPASAPALNPLDTVRIFGRYDFQNSPTVTVNGAVRRPGTYITSGQVHLRDAIQLAGGLTPDAQTQDAQVFHYLPDSRLKVMSIDLSEALAGSPMDNILLEPRDHILVYTNLAKVDPPTVAIRGEVARPGRYPLGKGMRVADLIRLGGGFKRSADTHTADLTVYPLGTANGPRGEEQAIKIDAALEGNRDANILLHDGDTLTIRELPGWKDIGATVTIAGEVVHPGVYGIRPGDRLSSLIERAGGFLPTAYPYGSVFTREDVRKLQQQSRVELIQRLKTEAATFQVALTDTAQEQAALQKAAEEQRAREVAALEQAPVTGRMVIHLRTNLARLKNSSDDIELRNGDRLFVPKRPEFVLVTGQVYIPNALTYRPNHDVGWYLRQAGGATTQGNRGATFVVRADGSIVSREGTGLWAGNVLSSPVQPGDTIVVPEKAVGGSAAWKNVIALAQVASAAAITAAVVIP